jgi:integrase
VKGLVKRGGVYYLRKMVQGKRVFRSLATGQLREAERRARALGAQLDSGRLEVLQETTARPDWATVGDCIEEYETGARMRGLSPKSMIGYRSALGVVLRSGAGVTRLEGASTRLLTRATIDRYAAQILEGLPPASDADARARRTIRSTLRQARAWWSRWAMERYAAAGLILPDLHGWMTYTPVQAAPRKYRLPPDALIGRTIAAGCELAEDRPALAAAFLCCHDLALRAGEAAALRWDWFRRADGRLYLDLIRRDGWAPKGSERTIPVDEEVWAALQQVGGAGEHVVPGSTFRVRYGVIARDLAAWMRALGWSAIEYPKAAHELRKLQGSRWFTELGPAVAQEWLGHASVATTCTYYAALSTHPQPLRRRLPASTEAALQIVSR